MGSESTERKTIMEVECHVVCRTTYGDKAGERTLWHEPFHATIKVVSETVCVDGFFSLPVSYVIMNDKEFAIFWARTGLGGRVITLCIRDERGLPVALYTDMLTPAGRESNPSFLEEYGRGDHEKWL